MELQLGLAPPNHLIKGFDLNSPEEIMGPAKWACVLGLCGGKRDFDEAFDGPIKTLPLLWKQDDGGDEDDDGAQMGLDDAHSFNQCNNRRSIVGWPPIKASRKLGYGGGSTQREEMDESKGGYVKVMMEGVAIGRKVDLTVHDSYQTLTHTLNNMFGIYEKSGKEDGAKSPRYKLAYQDKEGDWMLVGDVPWGTFVQTVQRLKIQKKND
ncbi:hypothetical protein MRB53_009316 [Persea americana]|uniref:Uncharacterized protein n=1 Tax=Persea americana TaxID=3435 RepID=A0ACC2LNP2_PERAE|nr:hypothetical protein MRB53_009316 [Persea americana]